MIKKEENQIRKKSGRGFFKKLEKEKSEYEQKVIDIARVTRVVKGGKRFSFRTVIVIGNKKGKIGVGVAKGADMKISSGKSFANAKKNLISLNFSSHTVPYQVYQKVNGAKILLKPASKGHGIVAGGAVRTVLNLAGINDASCKMLGSKNKLSNARATIKALKQFSVKKTREVILNAEKEKINKRDIEKSVKSVNEIKKNKTK